MGHLTPTEIWAAVVALVGGLTVIQIAPIKLDPWTWLARKIGKAINGEVIERMDKLEGAVRSMQDEAAEREAKSTRVRILRFGDEILHGVHHSKEHFDQILQDITEYDQYCDTHKEFKNNVTVLTTKHIMETYSACLEERKFELVSDPDTGKEGHHEAQLEEVV